MKNKKQNLAKFLQKVGEGRLTYGLSSRSFRAFFSEKKNEVVKIKVVANSIQNMFKKFELDERSASRKNIKLKIVP